MNLPSEHIRYLGVLGLLADCSLYVPEDIREMIELAFDHACSGDRSLRWSRTLSRLEINADFVQSRRQERREIE